MKTNFGIVYFQCQVPLHVLFSEQSLNTFPADQWVKQWTTGIPQINESVKVIPGAIYNLQKLENNNIVMVAGRVIDGIEYWYCASKLDNGAIFLFELKNTGGSLQVTVKSMAVHLLDAFQISVAAITF